MGEGDREEEDDFSDLGDLPQPAEMDRPIGQGPPDDFGEVDPGGLLYPFWQETISPIHYMVQAPDAVDWKQWADEVLTKVVEKIGPPQIELLPNAQEIRLVNDICQQLEMPQESNPWDMLDKLWHLVDEGKLELGVESNRKLFLLLHRIMRS